jgi:hypothetical protein
VSHAPRLPLLWPRLAAPPPLTPPAAPRPLCSSRPRLNHLAIDAISGAAGEVAALVALYPLDTIKVQVQARGSSTLAVLFDLSAAGPAAAARRLYAGCGSAAVGAAALGSLYLVTFFAAKRLGQAAADGQAAAAAAAAKHPRQQEPAAAAREQQQQQQGAGGAGGARSAAAVAAFAGVAASLVSSVVESPLELFKVRTQAGAAQGFILGNMARMVRSQGLGPLYLTLAPFLLKSIPHDVAELCTFSALTDLRAAANGGGSGPGSGDARAGDWRRAAAGAAGAALARLPHSASDMAVGAAAGAAAAVASMPFDVVFTRMQVGGAAGGGGGGFAATARAVVAAGGPQALYAGAVPRLLQTVPAAVVYWMAVEGCRRALTERYGAPPAPAPAGDGPPACPRAEQTAAPALALQAC